MPEEDYQDIIVTYEREEVTPLGQEPRDKRTRNNRTDFVLYTLDIDGEIVPADI